MCREVARRISSGHFEYTSLWPLKGHGVFKGVKKRRKSPGEEKEGKESRGRCALPAS
jgi:hypothetical protein